MFFLIRRNPLLSVQLRIVELNSKNIQHRTKAYCEIQLILVWWLMYQKLSRVELKIGQETTKIPQGYRLDIKNGIHPEGNNDRKYLPIKKHLCFSPGVKLAGRNLYLVLMQRCLHNAGLRNKKTLCLFIIKRQNDFKRVII